MSKKKKRKQFLFLLEDHPVVKMLLDAFNSVIKAKNVVDFYQATQKMFQADTYYNDQIREKYKNDPKIDTRLSVNFATHYNATKNIVQNYWLNNPNVEESVKQFWVDFFEEHGDFDEIVAERTKDKEIQKKEEAFYRIGKATRDFIEDNEIDVEEIIKPLKNSLRYSATFTKKLSQFIYDDISEDETTEIIQIFQNEVYSPDKNPSYLLSLLARIVSYFAQKINSKYVDDFSEECSKLIRDGRSYYLTFFYQGLTGKSYSRDVLD
ncbi:MAG: hypothetical protein NZZ41_04000 [Candidatus Dojkabacteria bacterium]|nr:hypothetical protein [Candidatus Dojkabacteria bacterium]